MGLVVVGAIVGFLVVWVQGLPGPHHGGYLAFAKLWNIRAALWYYDDVNGRLPPPAITNKNGEAICSWRVEVYEAFAQFGSGTTRQRDASGSIEYDRSKPWNDPRNLRLQACGVEFFEYAPRGEHAGPGVGGKYLTYCKAITGPGTAFDSADPRSLRELPHDLILVVRVERSDTHWMEPGDLTVEDLTASGKGRQLLLGENGYAVLFADGSPWILSSQLPFSDLCKFLTIADAEEYDRDTVLAPYRELSHEQ